MNRVNIFNTKYKFMYAFAYWISLVIYLNLFLSMHNKLTEQFDEKEVKKITKAELTDLRPLWYVELEEKIRKEMNELF